MNISGPRARSSPGDAGSESASVFGSTMRSSAAPISGPSVVASRSGSSPSRPVVSVGYSVEPYVRLHQQSNSRAPSRTIAGATPAPPSENRRTRRCDRWPRTSGWSIIVRMNTGVRDHHRDRSRLRAASSARARVPRVHQHRGDRVGDRQQHAVREPGDVRDRHRQQQRLAGAHVVRGRDGVGLDAQRLVRVHDALRLGGRARRPQDDGRVVDARPPASGVGRRRRAAARRRARRRTSPSNPASRAARGSRCRETSRGTAISRGARSARRMKPTSWARSVGVIGLAIAPQRHTAQQNTTASHQFGQLPARRRRRA